MRRSSWLRPGHPAALHSRYLSAASHARGASGFAASSHTRRSQNGM